MTDNMPLQGAIPRQADKSTINHLGQGHVPAFAPFSHAEGKREQARLREMETAR